MGADGVWEALLAELWTSLKKSVGRGLHATKRKWEIRAEKATSTATRSITGTWRSLNLEWLELSMHGIYQEASLQRWAWYASEELTLTLWVQSMGKHGRIFGKELIQPICVVEGHSEGMWAFGGRRVQGGKGQWGVCWNGPGKMWRGSELRQDGRIADRNNRLSLRLWKYFEASWTNSNLYEP